MSHELSWSYLKHDLMSQRSSSSSSWSDLSGVDAITDINVQSVTSKTLIATLLRKCVIEY